MILMASAQWKDQNRYLAYAQQQGIGFASKALSQSETLHWIKALPRGTTIYTNGPDAIKVFTDRSCEMILMFMHPVNRIENDNFANDILSMTAHLAENAGVIVYFNAITWRWYLPTVEQLGQVLPLQLVYQGKDGIAVRVNQDPQEGLVAPRPPRGRT